jgi:hypothetical protein
VSAIVQQELVLRVVVANHAQALEPWDFGNSARVQREYLVGTTRELIPLRLPRISTVPLPKPKPYEQGA